MLQKSNPCVQKMVPTSEMEAAASTGNSVNTLAQLPCVRRKINRNTDLQRSCSVTYAVVSYRSEQNSSKHRHTVCDVFSLRSTHCAIYLEGVRRQRNNGKTTGIVVQRRSDVLRLVK